MGVLELILLTPVADLENLRKQVRDFRTVRKGVHFRLGLSMYEGSVSLYEPNRENT